MVVTTGGVDEPAVGQRQEVEAVVDDVELAGVLERVGDVQRLGDLRARSASSSFQPCGEVLARRAVVTESAVANSVTS